MKTLKLNNINFAYENKTIFKNFNLELKQNLAILGPSGCGKSTLLRLIAGFIKPISGQIILEGKNITNLAAHKRNVGFLFQDYALFSHLNIAKNIAFGIRKNAKEEALKLMQDFNLTHLANSYPANLSGGEQQRVAFARALGAKPKILLLDEPFSALDLKLKEQLRDYTKELLHRLNIVCIMVTHDEEDAKVLEFARFYLE